MAVAVVLLASGFFSYRYFYSPDSGQINSIAVLPFENRSGNADSEYLSDGLAESLIYRLSQLPDLKVSPTSSVFRYKGKEKAFPNKEELAVEKDPAYALGYVGLADAFVLQQEYGSGTSVETLSNSRAYAIQALEIDPSLGEAHATLGLAAHYSYQWAEAESHFKKAIELNPRNATAVYLAK